MGTGEQNRSEIPFFDFAITIFEFRFTKFLFPQIHKHFLLIYYIELISGDVEQYIFIE